MGWSMIIWAGATCASLGDSCDHPAVKNACCAECKARATSTPPPSEGNGSPSRAASTPPPSEGNGSSSRATSTPPPSEGNGSSSSLALLQVDAKTASDQHLS